MTRYKPKKHDAIDLYRFYDSAGSLLYVGISLHTALRLMDHQRDKSWWSEVARIDIEHLEVLRHEAERVERRTIQRERPRYNQAGTDSEVSKTTPKFPCSTCGRNVASWGYVSLRAESVEGEHDSPEAWVSAYRTAADIAATGEYDRWLVSHANAKCTAAFRKDRWWTLDALDVWALHVGIRPGFRHQSPAIRDRLLEAWEAGDL